MPNKLKVQSQYGVAWPCIFAAVLEKDRLVKVSANETVDDAAAADVPRGYVVKSPEAANGIGSVMLRGRAVVEVLFNGNIAANAEVKMSSVSGANQRVAAWVAGTDAENLKVGWVLKGANSAVGLVVLY